MPDLSPPPSRRKLERLAGLGRRIVDLLSQLDALDRTAPLPAHLATEGGHLVRAARRALDKTSFQPVRLHPLHRQNLTAPILCAALLQAATLLNSLQRNEERRAARDVSGIYPRRSEEA